MRGFVTLFAAGGLFAAPDAATEFARSIRPVLEQNCGACHNPDNPRNRVDFLKARDVSGIESNRGLWRDVAVQLRNRTMPPVASKLSEQDRLRIAGWLETRLRSTACSAGDFAGAVPPRRLNRREYFATIRDLLGPDMSGSDLFPADESGGAGFDTNADTLYIPPMLLERYLEAAQKILDRVIVTPPLNRKVVSAEMDPPLPSDKPGRPMEPREELSAQVTVFLEGEYGIRVSVERPREIPFDLSVKVDEAAVGSMSFPRDSNGGPTARSVTLTLTRGVHKVTVAAGALPFVLYSVTVEQRSPEPSAEKRALHYRLFGTEPGQAPVEPRAAARRLLARFLPRAYRRPVESAEVDRFLTLYDRAARRGDPHEEAVKLALKAVLVSPRFLFRVERKAPDSGIHPLGHEDMASRLSYFLWSTMPDGELLQLAAAQRLQDPAVLAAQVERMLDDPRSRSFADAFVGQWLGTRDVGGRVVPLLTELQYYYTPEVAADLRQEPVLLFEHLIAENRSVIDLLTANYSFLNERLAKFYQVDGKVGGATGDAFERVEWPDANRAGVLGMASVLAMTSHYRQSSPVLRGAWVLDTLFGTPVPPPPPDVPPLEKAARSEKGLSMKEILSRHRTDPSCAACHNLMDPIGFGLENFDWMGRWRDKDSEGRPIDASGALPSGEQFRGPVELRQVLLTRKEDFLRHFTGKLLGYALGRPLQDGDHCAVQRIVDALEQDGYRARTLIREIVLSVPFRNTQGGAAAAVSSTPQPKRTSRKLLGDK